MTLPSDTQILITRDFDAPRHLVFQAYTTPELIKRWWAGKRGEVTVAEVDLRVGGSWRYVMDAVGGFEVAFHGEFREIVPNERIVTTEVYEGAPEGAGAALNTITFADGRRWHAPGAARRRPEPRGPRHDHRVRHGGRHAGGHGPARGGREVARLSGRGAGYRTGAFQRWITR